MSEIISIPGERNHPHTLYLGKCKLIHLCSNALPIPQNFRTNIYLDPDPAKSIHRSESFSNFLHMITRLAVGDWHHPVKIGTEFQITSPQDFIYIRTARPTNIGLLILGLLNVCYNLVGPLEVFERGVLANFALDEAPFAHMNMLANPSGKSGNTMQEENNALALNSTLSSNLTVVDVPAPNTQPQPLNSSNPNHAFISDPLDPKFRIYYRQISSTYEDVDLWAAFASALTLAATFDRDAGSASICRFPHAAPKSLLKIHDLVIMN